MWDESQLKKGKNISLLKMSRNVVHFQEIKEEQSKPKQSEPPKMEKFKYLFQIPNIISDPKLVQRRKTFETFTKNANLDLYYMHLKKASGIARSISQNADYKEVMSKIHNSKLQDQFTKKLVKNKGWVLTNELWSDKMQSQIQDQSRLKELSQMLQLQKIKLNSDEQMINYENYFKQQMKLQQESYKFHENDETIDVTYKESRTISRNMSVPLKQTDQSFFSREIMTAQIGSRPNISKAQSKLSLLLKETDDEVHSTQQVIVKLRQFNKDEADIQDRPRKLRIKKLFADKLNYVLQINKKLN